MDRLVVGLAVGLAVLRISLGLFPIAVVAWVLMWLTDRLYETSGLWVIAVPLRIVILFMQISFLAGCAGLLIGTVAVTGSLFNDAVRGRNPLTEVRLGWRGYLMLLLIPVAMAISSILIAVFHNWFDFNERGLGLVTLGARIVTAALQMGSVLVVLVWLACVPFFLWNRRGLSPTAG